MTTPPSHTPQRAQPESFRARNLRVSLTVKDLAKSVRWYTEVIGFTEGLRYDRDGTLAGIGLKAGDTSIYISQDDGKKGTERVVGLGFSMTFTTAQNVDEVAARIKRAGGTLDAEPADMPWGARLFRLTDPDGYRITISTEHA
jgi:uncharacterized glyoxalase superfamily protein PhnB